MNITIQQMRYFVTAAECLNFTKTAQKHYTSQPVVSKWIGKLEADLGEKLFERNRYSIKLTRTGEMLYISWKKILESFDLSLENAGVGPGKSSLRIGCLKMLEREEPLLSLIRRFEKRRPDVNMSLEFYGFRMLENLFYEGNLDIIFSYDVSIEEREGYEKKRLYKLPMYFAVANDNLPEDDSEALKALQSWPLLLLSASESREGGQNIIDICARLGLDFSNSGIRFLPNEETLEAYVRSGKGVTIGGSSIRYGSGDMIRLIPLGDNVVNYVSASRKSGHIPSPLKDFWDNYINKPINLSNSEINS
ncbi:MAG: LysR family transcriptional regulator [Oscillospiraceae bacterium]|jgi:DNA-binding transcriptional LysR family regulator